MAEWTDERIKTMQRMWDYGRSATEIANHLRGVTRSAVLGKLHRLGAKKRPAYEPSSIIGKRIRKRARERRERHTQPRTGWRFLPVEPLPPEEAAPATPVKLLDLERDMCRWPHGDPKSAAFGFCGAKRLPNLPYCRCHAEKAYRPPTDDKAPSYRTRLSNEITVTKDKVTA